MWTVRADRSAPERPPMLALALLTLSAMQESAPRHWEHVLVRHQSFEDFFSGGMASAYRAELNADAPVRLNTGAIPGSTEQIDQLWAQDPANLAGWLDGFYESTELYVTGGFEEALVSWNASVPEGTGMCLELRVRESGKTPWSPWLYVGDWGTVTPPPLYLRKDDPGGPKVDASAPLRTEFEGGKVDVDFFVSTRTWGRAQYRVRTTTAEPAKSRPVLLRSVSLCFSRRVDGPIPAHAPALERRIEVPFRSQKTEKPEIAGRICSPTSVAMLLEHRGVSNSTQQVADLLFDRRHDIYGNWTRAVQGAYELGVPGYLARFGDWKSVEESIASGQPLVISIAAKQGELVGAPYESTAGHLLVLTGFDGKGGVHVNDPAVADAAAGARTYSRTDLERVWMARGGTSYVLLPKAK